MLGKKLWFLANPDAAGMVLDARVPIMLTSRANTVQARIVSCAAAACLPHARSVNLRLEGGCSGV
jgi:phosphate acetyltransferase